MVFYDTAVLQGTRRMSSPPPSPDAILQTGQLLSIHVGQPREMLMESPLDGRPVPWTSAIFKSTISGAVTITSSAIPGDAPSDLQNHGGPDNVVLAYDAHHYPVWRERLSMPEIAPGSFGENFAVTGFSDDTVCIGDIWRVGTTLTLQITQARQPCYKLARRLVQPHIVKLVRENSWGGWYLRVLAPGPAEADMPIQLTHRPHPDWTAARAVQVMYNRKVDRTSAQQLAALPELSARWKRELLI